MKRRDTPPLGAARPLWQELVVAVAPIITTAVCDGVKGWVEHRRAARDGKPPKSTEKPS